MADKAQTKFWMVWDVNGNPPRVQHWTKQDAEQEARRLSALCPGRTFVVLACVSAFRAEIAPVQTIPVLKREPVDGEHIPF